VEKWTATRDIPLRLLPSESDRVYGDNVCSHSSLGIYTINIIIIASVYFFVNAL